MTVHRPVQTHGPFPPLDLGYLASFAASRELDTEFVIFDHAPSAEAIVRQEPSIVGFSVLTPAADHAGRLAAAIKRDIDVPIVVEGYHFSLVRRLPPAIDMALVGDGEETFADLIALWLRAHHLPRSELARIPGLRFRNHDGRLIDTAPRPPPQLDDLPPPDREALRVRDTLEHASQNRVNALLGRVGTPTTSILTARGCPFRCPFCCSGALFNPRFRWHSAEYVSHEINDLVEHFGVEVLHVLDDQFTADRQRLRSMRERLSTLRRRPSLCVLSRVDTFSDEVAEELAAMDVRHVGFGVESGSPSVLRRLKGPHVHKDLVRNAFRVARSHGMTTDGTFIIGALDETLEDIRQTIDFIHELLGLGMGKFSYGIGTPFPGTAWWQAAHARDLVRDDMLFELLDTKRLVPKRPLLTAPEVTLEKMAKFCDELDRLRALSDPRIKGNAVSFGERTSCSGATLTPEGLNEAR